MSPRLQELMLQAGYAAPHLATRAQKLVDLVVQDCIEQIETYKIPVGNSASGELACEWTYDALLEIRDDIKTLFEVKND